MQPDSNRIAAVAALVAYLAAGACAATLFAEYMTTSNPAPAALLRAYQRDASEHEARCRGERPRVVFLVDEDRRQP